MALPSVTIPRPSPMTILLLLLSLLNFVQSTFAKNQTKWVTYTTNSGDLIWLEDNRKPALYTQDFGDCLGKSTINVTRFDAAYYKDNMTVLFHLEGNTALNNESLMSESQSSCKGNSWLNQGSVYWRLCLWRITFSIGLQSLPCPDLQVRMHKQTAYFY